MESDSYLPALHDLNVALDQAESKNNTLLHLLKRAMNMIDVAVIVSDVDASLQLWNKTAGELIGLEHSGVPQEQWAEHFGLQDPNNQGELIPTHKLPLVRALKGERVQNELIFCRYGNGKGIMIDMFGEPVFDDDGKQIGAVVIFSEHKDER